MDDDVIFDYPTIAGVWANRAHVYSTPHEFTVDFIREDPAADRAIAVARVSFSTVLAGDLAEDLTRAWQDWVEHSSPPKDGG